MVVQTRPDWARVVKAVENSRDSRGDWVFSFDTETVDRGYPNIALVGFSLGWWENGVDKGAYIPVGHSTGEMQLAWADVAPDLTRLLTDPKAVKVMHNVKYDAKVVSLKGIEVDENIFDTLVASFFTNTNGVGSPAQVLSGNGEHGLKPLSKHLLNRTMTELTDLAKFEKEKTVRGAEIDVLRVDKVTVAALGAYAGDDATSPLLLRDIFLTSLEETPDVKKAFYNIQREFTFCLADMEMIGTEVDVDMLLTMRHAVESECRTLEREMFEARPKTNFQRIKDGDLVAKLVEGYDDLNDRFLLAPDDARYPKQIKVTGGKKNPVQTVVPSSKATSRKNLITASGLSGHPVVDYVRDDRLRPLLRANPDLAHKVFNPNSTADLCRILFDELGVQPLGEKGDNGEYSTKEEYVDIWAKQGVPFAKLLLRYRELTKLLGTYLVGMVDTLQPDNRVRTRFNQTGARTGRLSSSDPNLQNIPTSKEFPIRRAFVATGVSSSSYEVLEYVLDGDGKPTRFPKCLTVRAPGVGGWEVKDGRLVMWEWATPANNPLGVPFVLGVADYNQLELRLLAHCSNDPALVTALINGDDIHALTARAVFDEIPKDMPLKMVKLQFKELRGKAKPISFGVLYGMGPQKLANELGITVEEAKVIIEQRYMGYYVGVKEWIEEQHRFAMLNGYCLTAFGRRRHLPAAKLKRGKGLLTFGMENNSLISQAKRQSQNSPIQGTAADVVNLAMRNIRRALRAAKQGVDGVPSIPGHEHVPVTKLVRILLQVHDELIWEAHPAFANWSLDLIKSKMEDCVKLRVPLVVDAALGANWYDAKE